MGSRAVFYGVDTFPNFAIEHAPLPDVGEGDILVKTSLATVCGSDLHTISGKRKEATPSVLGHEAVGTVVSCQRRDIDLKEGDRVTFSIIDSCRECDYCTEHLPQKCPRLRKYGHQHISVGGGFNGCYASHILLGAGTDVFRLQDHVTDKMAAPINCAMATVVSALNNIPADFRRKAALVQGAGLLGVYSCALLRDRGFEKVYCSDVDQQRLAVVSRFGGIPCNTGGGTGCHEAPGPDSVDVVIEVCGVASVIAAGVRSLRPGGIYLLVGLVHPDSKLDVTAEQLIRKCLTVKGVHNYRPSDLGQAVEFLSKTSSQYPYEELVSDPFPLEELEKAIATANSGRYHRVAISFK